MVAFHRQNRRRLTIIASTVGFAITYVVVLHENILGSLLAGTQVDGVAVCEALLPAAGMAATVFLLLAVRSVKLCTRMRLIRVLTAVVVGLVWGRFLLVGLKLYYLPQYRLWSGGTVNTAEDWVVLFILVVVLALPPLVAVTSVRDVPWVVIICVLSSLIVYSKACLLPVEAPPLERLYWIGLYYIAFALGIMQTMCMAADYTDWQKVRRVGASGDIPGT